MKTHRLFLSVSLLIAGALAGRFVWPRQRGIPEVDIARVNAAWSAAAAATGFDEKLLAARPTEPALAKVWDFLQRLEQTPAGGFPALWAELQGKRTEDRDMYFPYSAEELLLVERWAELDSEAALAFLSKDHAKRDVIRTIFRVWSRMNEETAVAALTVMDEGSLRNSALAGIFSAAAEDPASLLAWGRRLTWLDAKKIQEAHFDAVIPPDALRRAYAHDPAACRELAAGMPGWFRTRLAALATISEAATSLPAALARIDAVDLKKENACRFMLDLLPLAESHPDRLFAITEHLSEKLGTGWLKWEGETDLQPLFTALAKAAPDRVRALLDTATAGNKIFAMVRADAAAGLFDTDPRTALQLAPAGDAWISEFLGGPMLRPGAAGSPQEALELVRTAPSSTMRDSLLQEALAGLMKTSPEAADAWIASLPSGELQAVASITVQHADLTPLRADLARAAASAAHSSDPGVLDRIQTMTQRAWQADPAATTAQIASWPEGAARDRALQSSGSIWAEGSTADALTWAESLPAQQQGQALAGIMNVWAANEPADASEYIATLPAGPERDAPVSAFARGLSRIDPAASLQWAATVQDPALRSASLTEIFAEFFKQDAAAARASLENVTGLTPSERHQFGNPPAAK